MASCFYCVAAAVAALAWAAPTRADTGHAEPLRKVTSVVRPDPGSGRLVRRVVVQPRTITPKVIEPAPVNGRVGVSGAAEASPGPEAGLKEVIAHLARKHDVDPLLVDSVIKVESNYNPYALSRAGAEGLMQLMPATARRFGVSNSFDARKNIEGGVKYLKYLHGIYGQDLRRILAAYNAGEGAVARYNGIPRYAETESYVYQVAKRFFEAKRRERAQPAVTQPAAKPDVEPSGDGPRPVEALIDGDGRLHLRTK